MKELAIRKDGSRPDDVEKDHMIVGFSGIIDFKADTVRTKKKILTDGKLLSLTKRTYEEMVYLGNPI